MKFPAQRTKRRALLLSVGYGQGHHAAACAIEEELEWRGWESRMIDPCLQSSPFFFHLTQLFYHFCVRKLPWLWRVTYAQTDTADWSQLVRHAWLRPCFDLLKSLIEDWKPDMIICTYPLYAYMLDRMKAQGQCSVPYVLVVTDALEISRPWMLSGASWVCLPDLSSLQLVQRRYGLEDDRTTATGFPVRRAFERVPTRKPPNVDHLNIVYGAFVEDRVLLEDIRLILETYPAAYITILAAERATHLGNKLAAPIAAGRIEVMGSCERMAELFHRSHLYIGKAGAATVFEAYASALPLVINYALPGQEAGNLEKILQDACGLHVEGSRDLVEAIVLLLDHQAHRWRMISHAMSVVYQREAAARIVSGAEQRFFRHDDKGE